VQRGVRWLLRLQNGDGGWPTFCRGWGRLPFDQSAPDLTAHVLRALHAVDGRPTPAVRRGLAYLARTQRADGAWLPLWFGEQRAPDRANQVLGTARVLRALELWEPDGSMRRRGVAYLVQAQNADGGWGGAAGIASSVETTALAVAALVDGPAAARGADWLAAAVADGRWTAAEPIGLYFAQLWYDELLYPMLWTVEALRRFTAATSRAGAASRPVPAR
jgi:squalene-hopene/tetraprenyl-beta-curcumene cyclase